MDLKLDNLTNDISLSSGDLVTVTGLEEAGQRIRDRLQTFITEWFLDLSYGVDYIGKILVKNPRTGIIAAHFRNEILKSADGEITSFSSEFVNREFKAEYSVLIDGETLTDEVTT